VSGIHGARGNKCCFKLLSLGSLSASNTFPTPTGPTLLIVRHVLDQSPAGEDRNDFRLGFHLLILLCITLVTLVETVRIELI
jgi:hypothetical protein